MFKINWFKKSTDDALKVATYESARKLAKDDSRRDQAREVLKAALAEIIAAEQARVAGAETVLVDLAAAVDADKDLIAAKETEAVEEITELDDELDDTTKSLNAVHDARVARLKAALAADIKQAQNNRDEKANAVADELDAFVTSHNFQEDVAYAVVAQAADVILR
jgi:hypothetical protein